MSVLDTILNPGSQNSTKIVGKSTIFLKVNDLGMFYKGPTKKSNIIFLPYEFFTILRKRTL